MCQECLHLHYQRLACHTGRLAKSTQQVVLLDGRQLGPLCHLAALHLPPKSTAKAPPDDAARQLFFQVIIAWHLWHCHCLEYPVLVQY